MSHDLPCALAYGPWHPWRGLRIEQLVHELAHPRDGERLLVGQGHEPPHWSAIACAMPGNVRLRSFFCSLYQSGNRLPDGDT